MKEYRIRYSKTKNCLVTQEIEGFVYFGMARCNTKVDTFRKKMGIDIAVNRLAKAKNKFVNIDILSELQFDEPLYCGGNNMYGVVRVKDVRSLLRDFENIDDICMHNAICSLVNE